MSMARPYRGMRPLSSSAMKDRGGVYVLARNVRRTRVPRPLAELPPDASPLAQVIHYILRRDGRSATEASLAAGHGRTYIRDIFNGTSQEPKGAKLQALADALGVNITVLIEGKVPTEPLDASFGVPPQSSNLLPLQESEIALLFVFRNLDRSRQERVVNFAASLLPGQVAKRQKRSKRG